MAVSTNTAVTTPDDDVAAQVKTWLEAGIPPILPGPQFRTLFKMGTTFFYDEITSGRLRAVKHAGKACVPIEEAIRYKNCLPPLGTRGDSTTASAATEAAAQPWVSARQAAVYEGRCVSAPPLLHPSRDC
jgi:hypothetical protein